MTSAHHTCWPSGGDGESRFCSCHYSAENAGSLLNVLAGLAQGKLLTGSSRGWQEGTGCATHQEPAETQRSCEGDGREERMGKELPLVFSKGHSQVIALAGSIWALAGG